MNIYGLPWTSTLHNVVAVFVSKVKFSPTSISITNNCMNSHTQKTNSASQKLLIFPRTSPNWLIKNHWKEPNYNKNYYGFIANSIESTISIVEVYAAGKPSISLFIYHPSSKKQGLKYKWLVALIQLEMLLIE